MDSYDRFGYHRDLHLLTHSLPTRRSSALLCPNRKPSSTVGNATTALTARIVATTGWLIPQDQRQRIGAVGELGEVQRRSEEHTSELQSLLRISYADFCLKKQT